MQVMYEFWRNFVDWRRVAKGSASDILVAFCFKIRILIQVILWVWIQIIYVHITY